MLNNARTRRLLAATVLTGGSLWIWSRNRERTRTFYSPEEFERFATGLRTFDAAQLDELGRLRFNWLCDVPLILEFTSSTKEHTVHWRYQYKIGTRLSAREHAMLGTKIDDPISLASREHHTRETWTQWCQAVKQSSGDEVLHRVDQSTFAERQASRIRERTNDEYHVKITLLYKERWTPLYWLTLCKWE